MHEFRFLILAACGALLPVMAVPACAQAVPDAIRARVNELVAQCAGAGGTLGDMSGQGRFVIPADLTGDGRTDFLVSEGNFPCNGRPGLFRSNGEARVQVFEGLAGGAARLLFDDRLLAYRMLAGSPVRLQIARRGVACGAGAAARCGDELRWNVSARSFDLIATDGRAQTPRAMVAAAVPTTSAAPAPAPAPAPAGLSSAAIPPMLSDAESRFKTQCRNRYMASKPPRTDWIAGACTEEWRRVVTSQPAAKALLRAVPAQAGERPTLDTLRQRLAGARWAAQPGRGELASGKLGTYSLGITGKGPPESVGINWSATGADLPLDIPAALLARGATLSLTRCEQTGVGEGSRSWAVSFPGRAAFELAVDQRTAPTGDAMSYYGASVRVDGAPARRGQTACEPFW